MKLQDTLSNLEKDLDTSQKVRIYLCGVTVYDESHIGHARTIIVFDVLRKYLESKGIEINFIQNFTDVDDKIINRAELEIVTANEISSRYIDHYFNDFDGLNLCASDIKDRIVYRKSASQGKGVTEFSPLDIKASDEIEYLHNFIYGDK